MAALDFDKSQSAAEPNDKMEFDTLVGIVDEYVRDSSPCEISIDCETRRWIVAAAKEDVLKELTLVSATFRA